MADGYMPRADTDALTWMTNFARGLSENPGLYFVTPAEAQHVSDAVEAFRAAFLLTRDNDTRTPKSIFVKDRIRVDAEAVCRVFYNRIKPNPDIGDGEKLAVGVRVNNPQRTRLAAPQSSPMLSLNQDPAGIHELMFTDSATPRSIAKPRGVTQLQLYRSVGDFRGIGVPVVDSPEQVMFVGCYSRCPIRLNYAPSDHGRVATYLARWMTRRGEVGPWSGAVTAPISTWALLSPALRAA